MTGLTRRQVAKGAAWMTPVIAAAAAAPAMAASPTANQCTPGVCPSGTLSNSWKATSGNIAQGTGTVGFVSSYSPAAGKQNCTGVTPGSGGGSATNVAVGEGDPSGPGGYLVFSQTVCLKAGATVAASFNWLSYAANRRAAYVQLFIEPYSGQAPSPVVALGGASLSTVVTAPAQSQNSKGSVTGTAYTVPLTGQYMVKIVWTFGTTPTDYGTKDSCNLGANDIGVTGLVLTCTGM